MSRTLLFTVTVVVSELVLGFVLAQALVKEFPGKSFFRTIHALPLMVAPIAVGATWRLMTVPGFGIAPYYLDRWFGIDYNIGRYAEHAFATTILMDVWHWTPFVTLTMLAGLSALPKEPMSRRWSTAPILAAAPSDVADDAGHHHDDVHSSMNARRRRGVPAHRRRAGRFGTIGIHLARRHDVD